MYDSKRAIYHALPVKSKGKESMVAFPSLQKISFFLATGFLMRIIAGNIK